MNTQAQNFYSICCVVFSGLSGLLIGFPVAMSYSATPSPISSLILLTFMLVGLKIGYKQRQHRAFFYVSLLTTLILTTLIGFNLR